MPGQKHSAEGNGSQLSGNGDGGVDAEGFECVVCGADTHDGDGWIFPVEDTEVTDITPSGLERELVADPRPICSISCKETFDNDVYETGSANMSE